MFTKIICSRVGRASLGLIITTASTANAWGVEQTVFSARFNSESSAGKSPLTLVVFREKNANPHSLREVKAEIRDGKRIEAHCSIARIESMDEKSNVIDMKCRSARLGALSSPVSIFFSTSPASGNRSPAIARTAFVRFGSWLQGYQQAVLRVDLDRSTAFMNGFRNQPNLPPRSPAMKLAQR